MVYAKKTEPHPSKLPELSNEEVIALEKSLRAMVDSWGWLQAEQEKEEEKRIERSSWFKRGAPKIKKRGI